MNSEAQCDYVRTAGVGTVEHCVRRFGHGGDHTGAMGGIVRADVAWSEWRHLHEDER